MAKSEMIVPIDMDKKKALEDLYKAKANAAQKLASGISGVTDGPDDVHDAFEEMMRYNQEIKNPESFLYRTVRNKSLDRKKSSITQKEFFLKDNSDTYRVIDNSAYDRMVSVEDAALNEIDKEELHIQFEHAQDEASLTLRERQVVQLSIGEDLSHEEIAAILQISTNAVKVHYHRARMKLQKVINNI